MQHWFIQRAVETGTAALQRSETVSVPNALTASSSPQSDPTQTHASSAAGPTLERAGADTGSQPRSPLLADGDHYATEGDGSFRTSTPPTMPSEHLSPKRRSLEIEEPREQPTGDIQADTTETQEILLEDVLEQSGPGPPVQDDLSLEPHSLQPPGDGTKALRHVQRLSGMINKVLFKRTQVDYQQQAAFRNMQLLLDSADALSYALNNVDGDGDPDAQRAKVAHLRHVCHNDFDAVRSQAVELQDLMASLSTLEFRLQGKEQQLATALDAPHVGLPPSDKDSAIYSDRDSAELPQSDTHPLLAKYYDRKGDEGIYLERLDDHEYHYAEGLTQRDLLRDRGDPLDISDEQFNDDYMRLRTQILIELKAAQEEAASLEAQCRAQGLNTDTKLARSEDAILTEDDVGLVDQIAPPITTNVIGPSKLLGAAVGSGPGARWNQGDIEEWLGDLPENQDNAPDSNASAVEDVDGPESPAILELQSGQSQASSLRIIEAALDFDTLDPALPTPDIINLSAPAPSNEKADVNLKSRLHAPKLDEPVLQTAVSSLTPLSTHTHSFEPPNDLPAACWSSSVRST